MKYLTLLLILSSSITCLAQRVYVTPNGSTSASGASWSNAISMGEALERATVGTEIWAKKGTYTPLDKVSGRKASFVISAGIELYGGFEGIESSIYERPLLSYSVLSGDLGEPETTSDNAYTVVIMKSSGQAVTIFDGFEVTGGNSRNFQDGLEMNSSGGGLYIAASTSDLSSHMIANCIFEDNTAHNGGAVLVDSGRPSFVNCTFSNNKADFNGGAVYNKGTASLASPIFRDCTFEDNSSNSGAGITNNGTNGEASPLLISCDFINNTSLMNGAAIYNIFNDNGETQTILDDCSFVGNDSVLGDDISDNGISRAIAIKAKKNGGSSLHPVAVRK